MLRTHYAISLVENALKIDSFVLQCSGMIDRPKLVVTVESLKASLESGEQQAMAQKLMFYDLAQSVTTWPRAWADLLMTPPSQVSSFVMERVPVLKIIMEGEHAEGAAQVRQKLRSYLPSLAFSNDPDGEAAAEQGADENGPVRGDQAGQDQDVQDGGAGKVPPGGAPGNSSTAPSSMLCLEAIHRFAESNTSQLLDESMDAFIWGKEEFDATFLIMVQHQLQYLVWTMYSGHLRENAAARSVCIDLSKKSADAVVISKSLLTQDKFEMMMAGSVSMTPVGVLGKDHFPLCAVLGVQFYVNSPKDLFALDCVVPAWCTKTVSRNDMAYFHVQSKSVPVLMYTSLADGGLQIQFSKDVSPKFLSVMKVHKAFATLSSEEQKQVRQEYEALADDEETTAMGMRASGSSKKTAWHQRSTAGPIQALQFDMRPLRAWTCFHVCSTVCQFAIIRLLFFNLQVTVQWHRL